MRATPCPLPRIAHALVRVMIERNSMSVRRVGAELMLDAAGAAEVLVGDRQASRDEVLAYLLRDDRLGDLLAPMIGRATTPIADVIGKALAN